MPPLAAANTAPTARGDRTQAGTLNRHGSCHASAHTWHAPGPAACAPDSCAVGRWEAVGHYRAGASSAERAVGRGAHCALLILIVPLLRRQTGAANYARPRAPEHIRTHASQPETEERIGTGAE